MNFLNKNFKTKPPTAIKTVNAPYRRLRNGLRNLILIPFLLFGFILPVKASGIKSEGPGDQFVIRWVEKSIPDIMSFGFDDLFPGKMRNRQYFTKKGFDAFYNNEQKALTREMVKTNGLVAIGMVSKTPEIISKKKDSDAQLWEVQAPFLISYTTAGINRIDYLMGTLMVQTSNDPVNTQGLAIDGLSVTSRDKDYLTDNEKLQEKEFRALLVLRKQNRDLQERIRQLEKELNNARE